MATRRSLQTLTRHTKSKFTFSTTPSNPNSLFQLPHQTQIHKFHPQALNSHPLLPTQNHIILQNYEKPISQFTHHFSSNGRNDDSEEDDEEGEDDDDEESSEEEGEFDEEDGERITSLSKREYSVEEKEQEAAEIGYKVMGPLDRSDRVFKPYEPVFAVVQIGSHQFKVSNGDCIFTERLKFCEVNDKLLLNKVLLLGSSSQTIIGRPILPDAAVYAVVEEHALDAKVIIFKKKRRKNYRRTKGHRQELTKLRIVDIQGIDKPEPAPLKPEKTAAKKSEKSAVKKPEKVAVVA